MIPVWFDNLCGGDLTFGVLFLLYIKLANDICFDSNKLALSQKPAIEFGKKVFTNSKENILPIYMRTAAVISVPLPLILICFSSDDIKKSVVISPMLLLLLQIYGEKRSRQYHDVCRVLVPIGFNMYRLIPLVAWTKEALHVYMNSSMTSLLGWNTFSLVLSATNLVFWSYNFFIFLLLRMLPVYFDKDDTPPIEMVSILIPYPKHRMKPKSQKE